MLDPIDLLEQSEDVRVAANATQSDSDTGRRKRGIERKSTFNVRLQASCIKNTPSVLTIYVFSWFY